MVCWEATEAASARRTTIPLTVRAWLEDRRSWPRADEAALWLNRRGGRLSTRSIEQFVGDIGRAAGVRGREPLTPHVLRHTFATRLLCQGVDVVIVAALLGHRRLDTTRRYILATAADREQAVDRLLVDD